MDGKNVGTGFEELFPKPFWSCCNYYTTWRKKVNIVIFVAKKLESES
jgi:hypothetical protein